MAGLLDKVREFLTEQDLRGGPMIAAVSGGPDSVALLRALARLREEFALRPLVIAHLNHRLRGPESDEDQVFVQELYRQLAAADPAAFALREHAIEVREQKSAGESMESIARTLRYQWLTAVAQDCGASWVGTGHTAGDQAETVLHRLLRGTGVKGLAGIPPRRDLMPTIEVVRPLLEVSRQEVADFLGQLNQPFRQDSSNADPRFTRNRIRRELLPLLERDYNPAIVEVLCRLANQARALQQDEENRAGELLAQAELPRAGGLLIFDLACLKNVPAHQIIEMFRLVWQRENWPQQYMGFREWHRLARLVNGKMTATDLPGPLRARRQGRVLQVGPVR